jgi:hypothetical protein
VLQASSDVVPAAPRSQHHTQQLQHLALLNTMIDLNKDQQVCSEAGSDSAQTLGDRQNAHALFDKLIPVNEKA